jgi:predicted DNA-binding WGR domain protein
MDLFGQWIVETRWGRIGATGQCQQRSFPDATAAQDYVRAILRKRRSARKRIGVEYQLNTLNNRRIMA